MSLLQTCFALSPSPQSFPRPLSSLFCDLIQHIPFAIQIILISTFKNAFCGLPSPPLDCQQLEARIMSNRTLCLPHLAQKSTKCCSEDRGWRGRGKVLETKEVTNCRHTYYLPPIIILMRISVPAHEITGEVSSRMCDMAWPSDWERAKPDRPQGKGTRKSGSWIPQYAHSELGQLITLDQMKPTPLEWHWK